MTVALERSGFAGTTTVPAALPNRAAAGGLIDRSQSLGFTFDGKPLSGCAGDTLASALLANGIKLVGRSFKYHRPRGILTAGSEEPNALVELRTGARREPNTRATTVELFDGLEASSQNRWPSLRYDFLSVNAALAPIFAAGFYYKTFMWPAAFWEKLYEPMIRRAAGLGRAANAPDPDLYEKSHVHCDVLVIGGGPTGLSAALAAARSGARVLLVDESDRLGGRLLCERREIDGRDGCEWAAAAAAELHGMPNVQILTRTTLFGMYDHGQYGAIERVADHLAGVPKFTPRQRYWRIIARRAVVAAGAIERPHIFGDNDRPGVMLAGAVRTYVNRFGVLPGRRVAILTSGDDGWRTLADIAAAGGDVVAVIDTRHDVRAELRTLADRAGIRVIVGGHVLGTKGRPELNAIRVVDHFGRSYDIACDCLAMSNGWNPVVHFDAHLGKRPIWNAQIEAFVPDGEGERHATAGAAAGAFSLLQSLETGAVAGLDAARRCGFSPSNAKVASSTDPEFDGHEALWRAPRMRGKAFVDFQNDVAATDVELAHREGFRAVEHLKRYTTLGMATDQGKTSNMAGLGIMAELTGQTVPQVGTTVFRPPYSPVALGAIAGHHRGEDFRPTRLTPSHVWAQQNGAVFVTSGAWMRAAYFPRHGETDWLESVTREVKTVRSAVGICDVSTFGKIDFQGPDALELIEAAYANAFASLPVGKARYALLLREDGIVLDDGTITRLGEQHYVATASTANAARVMQHLEFVHQWLNPDLDVQITSVSEQWAQFAVAGPRAREALSRIVDDGIDLSNAAFPFLTARKITAAGGIEARLFRISFSGELAYEIAVPARFGPAAWAGILEAGADLGIAPYGTEALGVMRIEKGHAATAELNGMTTARDLGLDKMLAKKKDYIGRLMKDRPGFRNPDRPTFIGLKPVAERDRIRAGSHVLALHATPNTANDEGFVSSVAFSPEVGQWIGLGFIKRGPDRIGERVRAFDPVRNGDIVCDICPACFVDPKEERLRA